MKLKDLIPPGILPDVEEDAISFLRADHDKLEDLFTSFDQIRDGRESAEKERLVRDVCGEFRIHTALEEEIFYPAVRAEIADDDLMNEALIEHEGAKRLVDELEAAEPMDELLNAKMHVLCAYLKHHIREEEQDMFRKARETTLDLRALAARMVKRKDELTRTAPPLPAARRPRSGKPLSEPRADR
jgi:hemerythrin-like domain-containing protein